VSDIRNFTKPIEPCANFLKLAMHKAQG